MSDRRVTFPREKPQAGTAQVVFAFRDSKGRRVEYRGVLPEGSVQILMQQAIENQVSADRKAKAAAVFSQYTGSRPLGETSVDNIPLAEQQAFWAALGEKGSMSEKDMDRLYVAWYSAQEKMVA